MTAFVVQGYIFEENINLSISVENNTVVLLKYF